MSDFPQSTLNVPKSIGQVLDRTFRLLRANLKVMVGISVFPPTILFLSFGILFAAVMLPMLSRMPKSSTPAYDMESAVRFLSTAGGAFLLYGAAFAPSLGAASNAAVHADFGVKMTFREAYGRTLPNYGRYLLLLVFIALIVMGPILVPEGVGCAASALLGRRFATPGAASVSAIAVGILLMLFAFVFSVLASLRLSLAIPACVAENLSAVSAIKRSIHLTRGAMGRIFVVLLVVYAITYAAYIVGMLAAMVAFFLVGLVGSGIHSSVPTAVSVVVVSCLGICILAVMILYMAIHAAGNTTALAVIYNDQRMRIDGPGPVTAE